MREHGRRIDPQAQRPRHVKASETRGARAVYCAALRCSRNRRCARVQRQTRVSNLSRSLWRLSVRFMVDYRLIASKLSTIVLGGTAAPFTPAWVWGRSFFILACVSDTEG